MLNEWINKWNMLIWLWFHYKQICRHQASFYWKLVIITLIVSLTTLAVWTYLFLKDILFGNVNSPGMGFYCNKFFLTPAAWCWSFKVILLREKIKIKWWCITLPNPPTSPSIGVVNGHIFFSAFCRVSGAHWPPRPVVPSICPLPLKVRLPFPALTLQLEESNPTNFSQTRIWRQPYLIIFLTYLFGHIRSKLQHMELLVAACGI